MIVIYLVMLGLLLGIVDVLPMVKRGIDRFSSVSAFIFHLTMPTILYYNNFQMHWLIKGGLLYLILCLPIVVLVSRDDKQSVPIILGTSIVLGMLASTTIHLLGY